jgi:hypothetical protein
VDHFSDESVERPILCRDRRAVEIIQYALDEIPIPVQLRRDRGVGANSEETLVELRGKSGDQLTLPGWQWGWAAHHSLREKRQILRLLGFERE